MTATDRLPAYKDSGVTAYLGDAREVLAALPAASVDCCVTSPPYWGLRDYDLEPQLWGGDADCRHFWDRATGGGAGGRLCSACGAWLGHLGLEPSIELYVRHLVEVFRAVRRVLRPWATLWLNLGDCYNSGTSARRKPAPTRQGYWQAAGSMGDRRLHAVGVKTKDLVGIPWRVALALQADGWYLRSDVIWSKPNPMPESVTDRPTRAHEYLFLLAPGTRYFYDADAIREPHTMTPQRRLTPRDFQYGKDAGRAAHRRPPYALREETGVEGNPAGRN